MPAAFLMTLRMATEKICRPAIEVPLRVNGDRKSISLVSVEFSVEYWTYYRQPNTFCRQVLLLRELAWPVPEAAVAFALSATTAVFVCVVLLGMRARHLDAKPKQG